MARYIDADALKERLEYFSKWCKDGRKQGVDFVLDCPLPDMPTADVAPRAEVAREIFEEIEEYAELQIASLNIAEKVYSSGAAFFGGGKQAFVLLLDRLAELKNEYTEAEPPKGD